MSTLLQKLPDPQAVREHLGCAVREAAILRRLLRLAEQAQAERDSAPIVRNFRSTIRTKGAK